MSLFSLANRIAIVTGAARGNGASMAKGLAAAGAHVILLDILENELREVCNNINKNGKYSEYYVCDITSTKDLQNLVNDIKKKHKKIDILVNNAGITYGCDILEYPESMWDKTHDTNVKSPFILMQLVGRIMKENNSGSIINITSLNSELAFPNNPAYISSKGALKQLTKAFAADLGKYNIRANNIGPGYIMTDMTKESWSDSNKYKQRADKTTLGRWGKPEDLVGTVIYLASDASKYVTGQDIYVDGGWLIKGL